jgi:GDP-4-dehydro-6-deoxy-D-mannose reductase
MRALVTGSSGFVGRHLTEHLEASGDEVRGCDRDDGLDVTDGRAMQVLFEKVRPEVVYHLAGWSDVGGSWTAPLESLRLNAEGTLQVLLAARSVPSSRVLVVSSADVYGIVSDADLPITEDAPLRPVNPYAASKVAADFLALQAFLGYGVPALRVRAFNHLGPGQTDKFVASALAERIARNELDGTDVVPVGNLEARRDFTDVRDVVRAYRLLMQQGTPGEVYNVCSGAAVTVQALADELIGMAAFPMRLEPQASLVRPVDTPVLLGDNSRLRATTGWAPTIALRETLTDLLEEARKRVRA